MNNALSTVMDDSWLPCDPGSWIKRGKARFTRNRSDFGAESHPENYCEVKIKVLLMNHGRYDISYNYSYHGTAGITYNPFWSPPITRTAEQDGELSDGHEGEVIFKNSLSEKMIEYICMSNEELAEITGHAMPEDYRINVMRMLAMMWD